jgi:hypothetical protein
MFYTRVAPRTKSKGLPISGPLLSKKLMLFTRVAPRTKSKGLLISGPLLSKTLRLFTRVAPRIKSKGLPIYGPLFSKKITDQLESSSLSIIQTISHQILIGGSIYFSYTAVINIKEVRGIYLYLFASSSSSMQKKKITQPWGCHFHRTRQD